MDFWTYIITYMGLLFSLSSAQVLVSITMPLQGDEGDTLTIACGVVSDGSSQTPSPIAIRRNGVVFSDDRLSSYLNSTHKIYTLNRLNRSDEGSMVQCAFANALSSSVEIIVYYLPEIISITGLVGGELTVAETGSSNLIFSISANPMAGINVEPMRDVVVVMNNAVKFVNVMRTDAGLYSIRISNRLGNVSVNLTLIVEYPATFVADISAKFSCNYSSSSSIVMCAARPGVNGSLNCDFESVPEATLTVSLPENSAATQNGHSININGNSSNNAGIYTCNATNLVGGNSISVTRTIELFVGVDPEIEGITLMVNESVILAWEHTNSDSSIPIIQFTVKVRPLEGTRIIHETVPGDQFRLILDINMFEPRTSYVVTITANSLFGPSSPRDVSFMTGDGPSSTATTSSVSSDGPSSTATTSSVSSDELSSTATTSSVSSDELSSTATTSSVSSDGSSSTAMTSSVSLEGPSSTETSSVSPVSLSHLLTVLLHILFYEL